MSDDRTTATIIQHKAFRNGYTELTVIVKNYGIEQLTVSSAVQYDDHEIPFPHIVVSDDDDNNDNVCRYKPNNCYVPFGYFKEKFLDINIINFKRQEYQIKSD